MADVTLYGYALDHWEPKHKSDITHLCGYNRRSSCEIFKRCKFSSKGAHGATYLLSEKERKKGEDMLARCRQYRILVTQEGAGELEFMGDSNVQGCS